MGHSHRFAQAVALAAGLHAATFWFVRPDGSIAPLAAPRAPAAETLFELELSELAKPLENVERRTLEPPGSLESARRSDVTSPSVAGVAAVETTPAPALDGAGAPSEGVLDSTLPETTTNDTTPSGSPGAVATGTQPQLSLQALGVLGGIRETMPVPGAPPLDAAGQAELRLERSMAQATLEHDQTVGLHAAGPLMRSLHETVTGSNTPVNSKAIFSAVIGPDGRIVSLQVVQSDGPRPAWDEVARRVLALLANRPTQAPKQPRGVQLVVEVVSREQLPSGADPGMSVSVAGIPLQRGKGSKSASLTILGPPKIVERTVKLGNQEVKVPQLELSVIGLKGDVSDIGAQARRMVHTRLLKQRAL